MSGDAHMTTRVLRCKIFVCLFVSFRYRSSLLLQAACVPEVMLLKLTIPQKYKTQSIRFFERLFGNRQII